MKLGNLDISTVKLGASQVQAIYQGENLMWQNAPVATAATGIGQTSFTANWNAYTGAVVYLLDVSASPTFATFIYENQQVNAPSTSYVVIGLNPNTTYYYRVRASTEALTDPDYQAVLNYATTQGYTLPSASQQTLQNQLVVDLKTAGVWSKLDTFGVFATNGDSDFALIDWIRLSQYTAVNSPTFTANEGFQGDGATSYLSTNFNPSTSGVNYTASDASFGAYYDYVGAGGYVVFVRTDTGVNENFINSTYRISTINSNDITNRRDFPANINIYFKIVSLNGGNQYLIADGITTDTFTFVGTPTVINENWLILRNVGGGGYSNAQVRAFFMGSDTESVGADFNNALTTYYNSL